MVAGEWVAIIDVATGALHLPGNQHAMGRCGAGPFFVMVVGPVSSLAWAEVADHWCPRCWPEPPEGTRLL